MAAEPRRSCQDPVPHCDKPCNKVLACGHLCLDKCHVGSCAPCTQRIDITCRCGRTSARSACHQGTIEHPQCFRVCRAQLNCGRHECGERCCSGEKKAAERRKQKRSANDNYEPEHICLQVCGRLLKCGKHACQQLCHRGPCMACPEAIFDEISCSCGRTVLQPPQPCGTRPPECRFPCTRARPCDHPSVSHQCHPDETACPKCPFLMEKSCICGKKMLKNQPCWFEEGRCGLPCGKKLKCGTHDCRKPCHKPGECEDAGITGSHCSQLCGKIRKSCDHTCAEECHAPYPCKEDKPCQSKTFITCPCQHRKQEVRCQATMLNPSPTRDSTLKCDDECLRLQRNRQLAEALKIDPETHTDDHIPYSDTTLKLFRENITWAQAQEREFRVFAGTPEDKRLRFKPMPAHQRAFLHTLAEDFGLDSESQDPEPHRHVCIFKTPRFVSAPKKTLAQCLRIAKSLAAALNPPVPVATTSQQEYFNALLLSNLRFGLTTDELETALATELSTASRAGPALTFAISFLPASDEVLIKAVPNRTAAAIATSLASTPQAVETALTTLKTAIAKTVTREKLAGGWWGEKRVGGSFVALRKLGGGTGKKKEVEEENVEEDLLAAAKKDEEERERGKEGRRG
ncbi:FKBP12-associated protein [Collariella sp. IMI 366227]|nr:FKBP12-associated protein [Collariella sp. IMI 366227]